MGTATNQNHFLKSLLITLLGILTLTSSLHAEGWWNKEWKIRKKITLDTGSTGVAIGEPVGTATVLIRLVDFQFDAAKDDGSDIRFVAADDKTALAYHIEKYDALMGEAFVWVKVPDIKPGAQTTFWMYYGNASTTVVKADDAKGSFDSDTVLAYHFSGSAGADSSASGNNAENAGTPSEGSMIGGGYRMGGTTPATIPPSPSLEWTEGGSMTWSAWVKPSVLSANAVIFHRKEDAKSLVIGMDAGVPFVDVNGTRSTPTAATPVEANSWHHLAVVAAGTKITVYLDGETYATLATGIPALNTPLLLGGNGADAMSGGTAFAGELDELVISRVARPIGLIQFQAFSQGAEKAAKLLVLAPDTVQTNWLSWLEGGYMGVIIMNLTFDGWLVIGILAIMLVISWYVMYSKIRYLNAIAKGNAMFMKEWGKVSSDLTVLDDDDKAKTLGGAIDKANQKEMRKSSAYRIYHIGVEEIRKRLSIDRKEGVRRGLAGRSIQAIRASLDGGLVRETQKINSLVVLLTICISGGPFLGLLGTVVGVMITFAAVAQAGDVNVNAIAPGIAAALLATVAGLAVAIPALFGYNYILSRVKDAKDDMHIFIDEFVTKMAEFYKERNDSSGESGGGH